MPNHKVKEYVEQKRCRKAMLLHPTINGEFLAKVSVATPLWEKCEVATHTPKNGTWESSGTPKNSERDCRGQNTLHRGVLYTVGKVLKCKCLK
jgi:hypothetical protein